MATGRGRGLRGHIRSHIGCKKQRSLSDTKHVVKLYPDGGGHTRQPRPREGNIFWWYLSLPCPMGASLQLYSVFASSHKQPCKKRMGTVSILGCQIAAVQRFHLFRR
jgi:hypothetical protein